MDTALEHKKIDCAIYSDESMPAALANFPVIAGFDATAQVYT